ncbi:hypothetical protein C8A01DRAFT_38078 [Parachaetomium inaequale]|uniref:Uncharacterized protein n=1 Tax=Parachaetomium inaequale TaxID=2588326 RepID=A0AAN6PDF8_9PEZI|nr:hypothetical protein C8A01DRAFT_38078 [Parachaetomium inaequale]
MAPAAQNSQLQDTTLPTLPKPPKADDHGCIAEAKRLAQPHEHGLAAQALLEWEGLGGNIFCLTTPPHVWYSGWLLDWVPQGMAYALDKLSPSTHTFHLPGDLNSTAQMATMAIPILLHCGKLRPSENNTVTNDVNLARSEAHIRHLLEHVPRTPTGAISHYNSIATIRAESVFSVLPALAWHGMTADDMAMFDRALALWRTYRTELNPLGNSWWAVQSCALCDDPGRPSCGCLKRRHITPVALAAAGLLRLLGVVKYVNGLARQEQKLQSRAPSEIETFRGGEEHALQEEVIRLLEVALDEQAVDEETGLVLHWLDNKTTPRVVSVGGTALLVATIYNLVMMIPESASAFKPQLMWANKRYHAVIRWLDTERAEREGDRVNHRSCGLYCSALMMMGARNNPRLRQVLSLAGEGQQNQAQDTQQRGESQQGEQSANSWAGDVDGNIARNRKQKAD